MAADLASSPVGGLRSQLFGDAHLSNFGIFDTPQRTLMFGINDFDDTLPGPVEWDVKRLAASVEIAGRDLGFTVAQRDRAVLATARAYRLAMHEFATMRHLELWYTRLLVSDLRKRLKYRADHETSHEVKRDVRKALRRDHLHAFDHHVRIVQGRPRFVSKPPLLVPVDELLDGPQRDQYVKMVRDFLRRYRDSLPPDRRLLLETFHFVDMARKVVGVGSVGTEAWVALMMGRDAADPLLLQLKEAPDVGAGAVRG